MAEAARRGLSQRHQQPARLRRRPDQPTNASIEAAARAAGLEYALPAGRGELPDARRRSPRFAELLADAAASRSSRSAAPARARRACIWQAAQRAERAARSVRSRARRTRPAASANPYIAAARHRRPRIGGLEGPVAARRERLSLPEARRLRCHADRSLQRVRWPLGRLAASLRRSAPSTPSSARLQHQLERLPRDPVVPVRGGVPASARHTLLRQEHVRIDVIYGALLERTQGSGSTSSACRLLPAACASPMIHLSLPLS